MQVPGYLAKKGELKELGIDEIIIFCVNDGAVMKAWAKDQGIGEDYYTMMGDPCAYLSCLSLPQLSHTQHSTHSTHSTHNKRARTHADYERRPQRVVPTCRRVSTTWCFKANSLLPLCEAGTRSSPTSLTWR